MTPSTKAAIWERYHAGDDIYTLASDYGFESTLPIIDALRSEARRRHRRIPVVCPDRREFERNRKERLTRTECRPL